MAYIIGPDVVKYACTCGLLKSIPNLYFCRYCSQLRCSFCVYHEVDSIFCGKCSENIPSSEARIKKNRCANCFICPSCHQELSTRVANKGPTDTEDATPQFKKNFYLSCLFCRWSSRDVGIPDQQRATGGWPERENVHANQLQELVDSYKTIVLAQKQQKEKEKKKQRERKFISYTDRTGVTAADLRKRIGLREHPHPMLKRPKEPESAIAVSEVDDLPDSLFTEPINLMEITTVDQRLLQPEMQPVTVDKIFPVHKQLSIKQSLRCRACEHNVSKPEYNPNSVKFKIQLFAYYHIPEVRIVTVEPLRSGKTCELIIKFTNPTQHQTTITFLEINLDEEISESEIQELSDNMDQTLSLQEKQQMSLPSLSLPGSQPNSLIGLPARQPSLAVKPRKIGENINCKVEIPTSTFILPPRDDAAEYDDSADTHSIVDDPNLVKWRKSNKAFIKLAVTPYEDLVLGQEVVCGFVMQHVYTNTIATTVENKQPQMYNHKVKLFLNLGNIVGSN